MLTQDQLRTISNKTKLQVSNDVATAVFTLDVYNKFFRFKVFVVENSSASKPASAANIPLNRPAIELILNRLRDISKKDEEVEYKVESYSPVWVDNKMTEDKTLSGTIIVGKKKIEEAYICYITIINTENKKYTFKLLPSPYIRLYKNGVPLNDTEGSNLWAEAYASTLEKILTIAPDIEEIEGQSSNNKATVSVSDIV